MPGFCHGRHARHVAITSRTISLTVLGRPAASKIRSMAVLEACHQRRWSLRTSFRWSASDPVLRTRRLRSMLNRVQSVGVSSTDGGFSRTRGIPLGRDALGSWSGPRPARSPAVSPSSATDARRSPSGPPLPLEADGRSSGSSSSTSGTRGGGSSALTSGAEALPRGDSAAGTSASRGCLERRNRVPDSRVGVKVIRHRSSFVCSGCPLGRGRRSPSGFLWLHPGHVHSGSSWSGRTSGYLHCPGMRLWPRRNLGSCS